MKTLQLDRCIFFYYLRLQKVGHPHQMVLDWAFLRFMDGGRFNNSVFKSLQTLQPNAYVILFMSWTHDNWQDHKDFNSFLKKSISFCHSPKHILKLCRVLDVKKYVIMTV